MSITQITRAQWEAIDKQVSEVLRPTITLLGMLARKSEASLQTSVRYAMGTEMRRATHGQTFHYEQANTVSRAWKTVPVDFIDIPVLIGYHEQALSAREGMMSLALQAEIEANSKMYEEIEQTIFHGSITGNPGVCNFTDAHSVCNLETITGGDYTADVANFINNLNEAISYLKTWRVKPPYEFIGTPGIEAEILAEWGAAYGGNTWRAVKETYLKDENLISNFKFSDRIIDGDLTVNNQGFLLFKSDLNSGYIHETSPITREPNTTLKQYDKDIAYHLQWAGTFVPKNGRSFVLVEDAITTTAY